MLFPVMKVRFAGKDLERLEFDYGFNGGLAAELVKLFRKRVQYIRSAADERDFYALKSLHYEKLEGKRGHQRSMRLNDQYRLVVEMEEEQDGKTIVIVDIEDYH